MSLAALGRRAADEGDPMSGASVPTEQLERARRRLSAALLDCLVWIEAHPLGSAAADTPPPKKEAAGAPHPAARTVTSTTTTLAQRSGLEDGRGC
jgi:hypothetical protein